LTTVRRQKSIAGKNLEIALKGLAQTNNVGKVGWLKGATYNKGTPVAYVATIQEFGHASGNIPPRPYMRPTIEKQKTNWQNLAISEAKKVITNQKTANGLLDVIGQKAAGDFREAITKLTTPPLKESTIKARARKRANGEITKTLAKPLIDSGIMLNTLTNSVEPE
jgi:hypothetical protein